MRARKTFDLPGQRHFVTFSTYQRRRFLDSPNTREIVRQVLEQCLSTHHASCTGFVIMPDHVHAILFGESEFQISRFMQVWKKTSSYRLKRLYDQEITHYRKLCPKKCPVWQTGFYDFNLESDDKMMEKLDYMHQNPVKAGLSMISIGWAWSSARFYERNESVGVTITS